MRLALIGVGQAGGKIVDRFLEYERQVGGGWITSVTAINTARTDLHGLEWVPEDRRILIGQSRTKGHGVGADNELGAEIANHNRAEITSAINDVPIADTDAFLIVAALGGGTGSGAGPVIASHLKEIYTEPVYGLGVLPASDEGGIYTLNAARSFRTFTREVDNLLLFDNDAWRKANESIERGYEQINDEIVRRFGTLFSAGEIEDRGAVAETVIDSAEVVNTLACGGVSTVGYASTEVNRSNQSGLLSRFRSDGRNGETYDDATNRITSLVRKATLGRLTLPCTIESTNRGLIVAAGQSEYLNRRGIERGRQWLEREAETTEIRGGDYPLYDEGKVATIVLLSGITEAPRIDELQRHAAETQSQVEERDAKHQAEFAELVTDEHDEIDPLF